jgi:membrane fusion protein (multidrug efflux system)
VVLASAAIIGGWYWIHSAPASESTDDAYVTADIANVAPKVAGLIAAVAVKDNDVVHAGDTLVKIDPEEFDARLASRAADLKTAIAAAGGARAELARLAADERLEQAHVAVAQTEIRSTEVTQDRAARDDERFGALVGAGAIAERDAERYHNTAVTAEQDAAHAIAALKAAAETVNAVRAKRAVLLANVAKAEGEVDRARAALALAHQDQAHAVIKAASDGVVGNHQIQVGDYVQPGSRLFTLVMANSSYVIANFKESQTTRMRPGQKVKVRLDALPDQVIDAHIESIAPGTGSQFSLIPFEPGTGNFTKIVQRVPVRVRFDSDVSKIPAMRPGLSATAEVNLL